MKRIITTYREAKIAFPLFLGLTWLWHPHTSKLGYLKALWRERRSFRTALKLVRAGKRISAAVNGKYTIGR